MGLCTAAPNRKPSEVDVYLESESGSFTVIVSVRVKPYSSTLKMQITRVRQFVIALRRVRNIRARFQASGVGLYGCEGTKKPRRPFENSTPAPALARLQRLLLGLARGFLCSVGCSLEEHLTCSLTA